MQDASPRNPHSSQTDGYRAPRWRCMMEERHDETAEDLAARQGMHQAIASLGRIGVTGLATALLPSPLLSGTLQSVRKGPCTATLLPHALSPRHERLGVWSPTRW